MPAPSIAINLEAIADNTREIARRCAAQGARVFGVTKATRGSLVRPIDATLGSERGFYLLIPKDVPLGKSARLFRDWILAEAKGGDRPDIGR